MQLKSLLAGGFLSLTAILSLGQGQGSVDYSFNPIDQYEATGANNEVRAIARQADGKIIIAGSFTNYNGTAINRVARLHPDGSTDETFAIGSGANEIVNSVAIQSDGKIVLAGNFTSFNGVTTNRIVRLNPSGSIDTQFSIGTGANRVINAVELQADGKILIGGNFTTYNRTTINRIARLNANGTLDAGFTVGNGANSEVRAIKVLTNGKILIAGAFTTYNRITRNRLAQLNSNGTLDTGFAPSSGANNTIYSVAVQTNSAIILGGNFTTFNGTSRNRIARVNSNGTLDTGFNPGSGANGIVNSITINTDGLIVLGGAFTTINGTNRNYIAALNTNGSLNSAFNPTNGAGASINQIFLLSANKLLIGGTFTSYNGIARNRIVRAMPNGNIDVLFNASTGANDIVNAIAIQSNQKIIAAGNFTTYNDTVAIRLVRLNTNGSVDLTFSTGTGANGAINAIAIQSDGKIIIGGDFTTFNGASANRIARLNSNGTLDATFNVGSGANGAVNAIAIQTDGKVIIAGAFTTFNGTTRNRIARLNTNGSYDTGFSTGTAANNTINSIALQPDGRIVIGGTFTSYNGTTRNRVARIGTNGSLDAAFNPGTGANNTVNALAIQPNGRIILGGIFTTFNGTSINRIVRLNADGTRDVSFTPGTGANNAINAITVQPDNNILLGGDFTSYNGTPINRLVRVTSIGTIDTDITVGAGANGLVRTIVLQPDSKILVGGNFTTFNGVKRTRIARLFNCFITGSSLTQIACNEFTLNGITYTESGNYIQTLTNAAGCDSIITLNLTIIEIVASITSNSPVCEGETIQLQTEQQSGFTYSWSGPNGFASTIHNPVIANALPENEGTYTLTISSPYGCQIQLTTNVEVEPLPSLEIISNSPVCSGSTLNITARGNGDGYQWTGPNGFTSNEETIRIPNVSSAFSGTYIATTLSPAGCLAQASVNIEVSGSYIDENLDDYTFNQVTGPNNWITWSQSLSGNRIVLAGHFIGYNRLPYNRIAVIGPDGMLDTDFNPCTGANKSVYAIVKQSDEKLVIAGDFTRYGSNLVNGIARLNTDGSIDLSYNTGLGFDSRIYTLAVQPDDKVIVGGAFATFNGETRNRIIRLNTNGTPDETFNVGTGANGNIFIVLVQPDGKILVGGSFTRYNGAVVRNLIRLNPNGTLDTQFNPGTGPNGNVRAMMLAGNKIVIAGNFTEFNGASAVRIAQLNSNGSLDETFSTGLGPNSVVYSLGLQSTGKIIVGGNFTSFNTTPNVNRIARLNPDGSLDESFQSGTGASNYVYHINVMSDDRILIVGPFIRYNEAQKRFIAFLSPNGNLSENYIPLGSGGANSTIFSIKLQGDEKPVIAGSFTAYNGKLVNRVARILTTGNLDETLSITEGPNGLLRAAELLPNGKILLGGFFTQFDGTVQNRIAKLNGNGSLDDSFQTGTGFNGPVYAIKALPDGKILVGGSYSLFNGITRRGLTRINSDGSLDPAFVTGTGSNGAIHAIAPLANGKILVGGAFSTFNSAPAGRIVQLQSNGSIDTQFNTGAGANGTVLAIATQPDGRIILAGQFTQFNGEVANRIVRLNPDGSMDASFSIGLGANHNINTLALQSDGKIVIGGDFTQFNGVSINRIARLNANGTLDSTFNPNGAGANRTVWSIALTPDNTQLYVVGAFNYFNGNSRARIARLRLSAQPKTLEYNQVSCGCFTINGETFTESGRYTFQTTDTFGDQNTVLVNLQIVKPNAGVARVGQSLIAEASQSTYQWIDSQADEPIAGATGKIFRPVRNGYYSLRVKEGDCEARSEVIWFQKDAPAESDLAVALAYPNPTTGHFSLNFGEAFHTVRVSITDAVGRTVYSNIFTDAYSAEISLGNVPNGIYVVRISADTDNRTLKLVVKN